MHSPEEQQRLRESWARTEKYLRAARAQISADVAVQSRESLASYEQWLKHNELELALDDLESSNPQGTPEFWRNLLAAAENMQLADHAARYRKRLAGDRYDSE